MENTPQSPAEEPDWEAERRAKRIEACRRLCGLTEREISNIKTKFEVTEDNRKAYKAACDFVSMPLASNLYIFGNAGLGKSRMAHGIVANAVEAGIHAVFWTTTKFLMTLRAKSLETDEIQAMKDMLSPQIIVLDDFGANKITEWSLMMTDTIFDEWYRAGRKGLVVTSNFSLDHIGMNISDRVASRIAEMCKVFEVKGKDWRVR